VTITRRDLPTNGDILSQSIHSATEFAHKHPNLFKDWMTNSQYVVSLSANDEQHLKEIYTKLEWFGANVVKFHEPDMDNQLTSIAYYGTPELMRITDNLKLALS
jgi:peptidyl-tRNA hydrolase